MSKDRINSRGQILFNSPQELLASVDASQLREDPQWLNETREQYIHRTATGDVSRVADAEKLLDKLEVALSRDVTVWTNSVVGAFPDVPAFLANDPDCMRRRLANNEENAPIRVWVDISSSAQFAPKDLLPRGIAALALVMQLIRRGRAVELWTYCSLWGWGGSFVPCVRMNTTPVDIASIAYCLTSQGFSRGVCYGAGWQYGGFNGMWSKHYVGEGTYEQRLAGARATLAGLVEEKDVILPAPFIKDKQDKGVAGLLWRDPVQWVVETCNKLEQTSEA